jgi:hypothetical protein
MKDRKDPSPQSPLARWARSPRLAALPDTGGFLATMVVAKALQAPKIPPLQGD